MIKKKETSVVTFTVPQELKEVLEIIPSIGYYDSLSEFLRDAIRSFFKANKGMAVLVAFHLWKAKRISMGEAAAFMNLSLNEAEEMLKQLE